MATPLLTTKLRPPSPRSPLVARPHLLARLDEALQHRLTLVSAPPGYGKTTLLSEWLRRCEHPFAWLSLDEEDNDPVRLLHYLVAALQKINPQIGQTVVGMLLAPQPAQPELVLTMLINDIDGVTGPLALVLDDYQVIHTLAIHRLLTYLLDHLPPQMHLVIASREDPPLPLSRWRARGQLLEVRQADLHFSLEETGDFLRQVMQLQLSPADVAAIHKRTEGWIAGMQLTALSLQGRDDAHELIQSFSGSHRHILDYLIQEVFERQTPAVQDFLLKTSILDQFTAQLCDTLTGRSDSHEILLALEQANLFILPLDESRQWYRYHRLFADLLRHRLDLVEGPDAARGLHRQASQWFSAQGSASDAIRHSLAAQDWPAAAALIGEATGPMLKQGEIATLLRWFQALPDQIIRASPELSLAYSWPLSFTGHL
ncbi:MAG: hypothetical protein OEV76_08835, partial [Anaerolineae bacterium]|nr:hypothetical protein [Anaerolineae bacterium]